MKIITTFSPARLLLLLAVLTSLAACKVGEEDPLFSLRSRDARLMGKWKIAEWSYKISYSDQSTNFFGEKIEEIENIEVTANGTTAHQHATYVEKTDGEVSYADTVIQDYSQFAFVMEILEGGTATIKADLTYTDANSGTTISTSEEVTDTWFWLDQDKDKSAVIINGATYLIEELRNNRLVLTGYSKSALSEIETFNSESVNANASMSYTERMVLEIVE